MLQVMHCIHAFGCEFLGHDVSLLFGCVVLINLHCHLIQEVLGQEVLCDLVILNLLLNCCGL